MYFKASSAAPFLLKGWSLQNVDGLLAAVIVTIALSAIRECLAHSLHVEEQIIGLKRNLILKNVLTQARRAGLHMINTAFAYTLMLCVMTYNVWLLVLVSLSAGFSYLFFRPLIERACRASQVPSNQRPKIALISSTILSQEYSFESQTELKRADDGRSLNEPLGSDNGESLILNSRLTDGQNHTESTNGDASKDRITSPSQTKVTFTEFNRVVEMKHTKANCCK